MPIFALIKCNKVTKEVFSGGGMMPKKRTAETRELTISAQISTLQTWNDCNCCVWETVFNPETSQQKMLRYILFK